MYNLLVGFAPDTAMHGRVVERTDPHVLEYIRPSGTIDLARLATLPTLVMPEVGFDEAQVARVGTVSDLRWSHDGDLHFRFVPNPTLPAFPTDQIQHVAVRLGIDRFEFSRTHWAVKDVDLYAVLAELQSGQVAPKAFDLPVATPRESDLIAVMMPFDARFDPVYAALGEAARAAGFRVNRADDIWDNTHIMDDVISLIWRAQVVVADLTGKNANVFYETGIAHALGREVIQITQNMGDVPFDLQSIRTLAYLNNSEGWGKLTAGVTARLQSLASR